MLTWPKDTRSLRLQRLPIYWMEVWLGVFAISHAQGQILNMVSAWW